MFDMAREPLDILISRNQILPDLIDGNVPAWPQIVDQRFARSPVVGILMLDVLEFITFEYCA